MGLAGVSAAGACSDEEAAKAGTKTGAAHSDVEPEAKAEPVTDEQRALWELTCPEALARGLNTAPPPPPPPLPANVEELIAAATLPLAEPTVGPAPELYGVVPRAFPGRLPRALGLDGSSCDPSPLEELQAAHPDEESLYCAVAFASAHCGRLERAWAWTERRAEDFPRSPGAQVAVPIRRLAAIQPEPTSRYPYREQLPPEQRLAVAVAVVADADAILETRPDDLDAHSVAMAAWIHQSMAHPLVEPPQTAEDLLQFLLVRRDSQRAWEHERALGEARGLSICGDTLEPGGECIPPPPLDEEAAESDAALMARVLGQRPSP